MRDYQIVSPSLEGVLNHDSLLYDGVKRPLELLRVLDGPSAKGTKSDARTKKEEVGNGDGDGGGTDMTGVGVRINVAGTGYKRKVGKNTELTEVEFKILQEYFFDLYGVFMKRLSHFLVDSDVSSDDSIKLQAMLQEMIKVRKWVVGK